MSAVVSLTINMTALDGYRQSPPCTETVPAEKPLSGGKRKKKTVAA